MVPRLLLTLAAFLSLAVPLCAEVKARDQQKERAICDKLAAVSPESVEAFKLGTAAMDNKDDAQAIRLFRRVLNRAPEFTPAMRRLGDSLIDSGQAEEGLSLLEKAVQLERSPENLISLAEALAYPGKEKQSTPQQKERALALAKEANQDYQGDDSDYPAVVASLALDVNDRIGFRQALDTLLKKYPDSMQTHYFNGLRLAMDEDWIAAEKEINRAEQLGLPHEVAKSVLDSGIHSRAMAWRWANYVLYVLTAWACGLFTLFLAGKAFSKLTLRFIERTELNSPVTKAESALRGCYRSLINAAGGYYYFSIPFVIFLVLAVTTSIVYGFLVVGRIPVKLVLILVAGSLITVYKMIHSLFVRVNSVEPGRSLSVDEAPELWELTREVAESVGTRPLEEIRITPGTEMAVYERGSYRERRNDRARRILLMGFGLVPGFGQNPFRAVLAHEYGHFSHRDTAGGDIAGRLNQDMMKFAYAMAHAGQAVWWNIGFQFLRLYHFLFRRITHGATRLQEVLADRAAAQNYGAGSFEEGLRHVVRRQIEFEHFTGREIRAALDSQRALQNLYALEMRPEQSVEEAINRALNRRTSEDDTHPSPVDRFRLLSRVVCLKQQAPAGDLRELFVDGDGIAKEMSSLVESRVREAIA